MEENRIDVLMTVLESASKEASFGFQDFLAKKYGEKPETIFVFSMIFFEYLYFFIHQLNRASFVTLTAADGQRLFKFILPRLVERNAKRLFNGVNDENIKLFLKEYNNAEMEYARSNVLVNPPGMNGPDMLSTLIFRIIEIIRNQFGLEIEVYSEIYPVIGDRLIDQMKLYFSDTKMERFIKDIEIPEK